MANEKKQIEQIHPSHRMGEEQGEILCLNGVNGIYTVRRCIDCGYGYVDDERGFVIDPELFDLCNVCEDY